MEEARQIVLTNTDEVRVTLWEFCPGTRTGPHRHSYVYAVVRVSGGTFRVTTDDQTHHQLIQEAGVAYPGKAGTSANIGAAASFIEVELKTVLP